MGLGIDCDTDFNMEVALDLDPAADIDVAVDFATHSALHTECVVHGKAPLLCQGVGCSKPCELVCNAPEHGTCWSRGRTYRGTNDEAQGLVPLCIRTNCGPAPPPFVCASPGVKAELEMMSQDTNPPQGLPRNARRWYEGPMMAKMTKNFFPSLMEAVMRIGRNQVGLCTRACVCARVWGCVCRWGVGRVHSPSLRPLVVCRDAGRIDAVCQRVSQEAPLRSPAHTVSDMHRRWSVRLWGLVSVVPVLRACVGAVRSSRDVWGVFVWTPEGAFTTAPVR